MVFFNIKNNSVPIRVDPAFHLMVKQYNFENGIQTRVMTKEIAERKEIIEKLLKDRRFEVKVWTLLDEVKVK